jgi:pimeloyl-ACP methyl ester carboxylesterase
VAWSTFLVAEQPVTRYATGSGSHIAFQVLGRGPAIVIVPGFASHLELEWEDRACRSFIRRLAAFATVVRFDKRGTGLSDPVRELPTLEQRDADLAAVIAAAGTRRPVLFGYSEGGPIAVRFAVAGHGSVRGLVLYGAAAHRPPPRVMEQLRAAAAAWGTGASIALFAPSQAGDPAARQAQARFERASASPAMARDLVESLLLTDVERLLPGVSVPTLVVHRTQDIVPVQEGRFIASRVAGITGPNVEVRQMDLVSGELPAGEFDFVHTRLVLMHIPAREQVLGRLCAALRPGGILMIEEQEGFPVLATATGAYRQAWLAFIRACRAAGTDPDWTRDLPLRLHRHGLADIDAELDVPLFRGGSAHARFWSLTWQQVRDRVAAVGEPAHVIDEGQADLADEQRWFTGPAMMTAWGQRPPA